MKIGSLPGAGTSEVEGVPGIFAFSANPICQYGWGKSMSKRCGEKTEEAPGPVCDLWREPVILTAAGSPEGFRKSAGTMIRSGSAPDSDSRSPEKRVCSVRTVPCVSCFT